MTQKAKLFLTGRSQAVRLPREFRFEGNEVFIRRDPVSGDVVLSRKPVTWEGFLAVAAKTAVPPDFMNDRQESPAEERELFLRIY
jgi:antitoxin VapB